MGIDVYTSLAYGVDIGQGDDTDLREKLIEASLNYMPKDLVEYLQDDSLDSFMELYLQARLGVVRPSPNYDDTDDWRNYWNKQTEVNEKIHCGLDSYGSADDGQSYVFYAKKIRSSDMYSPRTFEIDEVYPSEDELREYYQIGQELGINTENATFILSNYLSY